MTKTMTLEQQIDEARAALAELTADEAELSRLQSEQAAEIDALKVAGTRDFATLATLEGKRAALSSMLSEQRASIRVAREKVDNLEGLKARADGLAALQDQVVTLTARRKRVDALMVEMVTALTGTLARISAERMVWHHELEAAREEAASLFNLKRMESIGHGGASAVEDARRGWMAAYQELGEGAELALTVAPAGSAIGSVSQAYTGPLEESDPLAVVETLRQPMTRLFDAPIKRAIAGALYEANLNTPAKLKSERY